MSEQIARAVDQAATDIREELNLLSSAERDAMTPVVDLLLKDRTIPASSSKSNHGAFPGGLIVHTHRVWNVLRHLTSGCATATYDYLPDQVPLVQEGLRNQRIQLLESSSFKVAIIHDLNKIQDAAGARHYLPNILKNGKISEAKPWEVNEDSGLLQSLGRTFRGLENPEGGKPEWLEIVLAGDGVQVRDGLLSIAVAKSVSPTLTLTPFERNAILYHDGAYAGRSGLQGSECMLQILLHASDMIASRVLC